MIARRNSALVVLAAAFLLTACTTAAPASDTTGLPSESSDPAPSASPGEDPIAGEPKPTPTGEAPAVTSTPPAEWTTEELIGSCKVEWNNAGAVDWSGFSPDALVEPRGDYYYVAFESATTDEVRDCKISGTPSSPEVTLGS